MGRGNGVFGNHLWNVAFFFSFPQNSTALDMDKRLSIYLTLNSLKVV